MCYTKCQNLNDCDLTKFFNGHDNLKPLGIFSFLQIVCVTLNTLNNVVNYYL